MTGGIVIVVVLLLLAAAGIVSYDLASVFGQHDRHDKPRTVSRRPEGPATPLAGQGTGPAPLAGPVPLYQRGECPYPPAVCTECLIGQDTCGQCRGRWTRAADTRADLPALREPALVRPYVLAHEAQQAARRWMP